MPLTQSLPHKIARGLVRVGKKSRRKIDRVLAACSRIGNPDVFAPDSFIWTRELERNWPDIRAEVDAILCHREAVPPLRDISPDHKKIAGDGRWRSYFFVGVWPEITREYGALPQNNGGS